MTRFAIVLLGLTSLASAKATFLSVPWMYATSLAPAAHVDDRTGVANGAARSAVGSRLLRGRQLSSLVRDGAPPTLASSAPLGADGRVVDTPEVVVARAAHAAAHVNERINLANEIARSGGDLLDSSDIAQGARDSDGRSLNTPEDAAINRKVDLTNEAARSDDTLVHTVNGRVVPLVLDNGVVAALVPVGLDGRPLDVTARADQNLENDVRSVDALAVAGPTLAYGRLVY